MTCENAEPGEPSAGRLATSNGFGGRLRGKGPPQRDLAAQPILLHRIPGKHTTQLRCRSLKISIRSVSSMRTVNTRRSAKQFARDVAGS
jgi:hypothetical protein